MRAGAQVLLMAANPVNRSILRTALERPLEAESGRLYEVGPGGRDVLFVAFVIERWLQSAPAGPIEFDSEEAEWAVDALVEGWSATVVHTLAREPMTLDELDHAIPGTSRPALRRQIVTMQKAHQIEALDSGGGEAIYAITDWLRGGIAPIIAAARAERRNPADGMSPIDELDVEAGFRLSLALLELPKELSGSCRLGLNLDEDERSTMTGVTARIEQGYVISCTPGLTGKANAWAAASAGGWLDTVIEPDAKRVRTGGDRWLARALLDGLHKTMFGVPVS
jgi:DNA-binding HxlR family transcriptional regulator